jgi:chaperonin cofactor prefoldin
MLLKELITKIKTQQDKLINELHQKFEDLSDRFKSLTSSQKDLNDKIFNWKSLYFFIQKT